MVQRVQVSLVRVLAVLAMCALMGAPARAGQEAQRQAASVGTRQRVGLALGGGSARGLAHIGVLDRKSVV